MRSFSLLFSLSGAHATPFTQLLASQISFRAPLAPRHECRRSTFKGAAFTCTALKDLKSDPKTSPLAPSAALLAPPGLWDLARDARGATSKCQAEATLVLHLFERIVGRKAVRFRGEPQVNRWLKAS